MFGIALEDFFEGIKANTSKKLIFYMAIAMTVSIEALSITFLKDSIQHGSLIYLALIGYVLTALVFREALELGPMGVANALWNCGTIIVISLVGMIAYGDTYTNMQKLGIALAVASTICMITSDVSL